MSIPIIGQPKVTDWNFSMAVICVCKNVVIWCGKPGVNGLPGTIVMCPCGKQFTLMGFPVMNPVTHELDLPIAMSSGDRI